MNEIYHGGRYVALAEMGVGIEAKAAARSVGTQTEASDCCTCGCNESHIRQRNGWKDSSRGFPFVGKIGPSHFIAGTKGVSILNFCLVV